MIMRGPSAEALATLEQQLEGAIAEVGTRKAAQVGDDLFGLAVVLRSTPSLRRVLTDVSIEGAGQAAAGARDLRREGRRDLARPGASRRSPSGGPPRVTWPTSSSTSARSRSCSRPATTSTGWSTSCSPSAELVQGNPELRDALSDPSRSVDDKVVLVDGLLAGKVLAATLDPGQAVAGRVLPHGRGRARDVPAGRRARAPAAGGHRGGRRTSVGGREGPPRRGTDPAVRPRGAPQRPGRPRR